MSLNELEYRASKLADLADMLENEPEKLNEAMADLFTHNKARLEEVIDEQREYADYLRSWIDRSKRREAELRAQRLRHEELLGKLIEHAIAAIRRCPNLPWRDSYGKKLSLCTARRLVVDDIDLSTLDSRFVRTNLELKKTEVKAAMIAGEEIPWARMEETQYLRGL